LAAIHLRREVIGGERNCKLRAASGFSPIRSVNSVSARLLDHYTVRNPVTGLMVGSGTGLFQEEAT